MTFRQSSRIAAVTAMLVATAAPALTVEGAPKPLTLSAADIAAMPRVTVRWTVHGKTIACSGPWLIDVLVRAGLPSGEDVRGAALATVVAAIGADGYRAIFTLGELDRRLGNAPVIVADACEGAALPPEDGPLRLVAAADDRGARSVRQLARLTVMVLPAAP